VTQVRGITISSVGTTAHEDDKPKAEHQDAVAGKAGGKAPKRRELPPSDRLTVTYHDGSTGWRPYPTQRMRFSRDDVRLFWVTLAGTVVANILTVMIVAVAIILARQTSSRTPTTALSSLSSARG
jgi:hypothetical protein